MGSIDIYTSLPCVISDLFHILPDSVRVEDLEHDLHVVAGAVVGPRDEEVVLPGVELKRVRNRRERAERQREDSGQRKIFRFR